MSIASRAGKLSSPRRSDELKVAWWACREDLLTADVFGALRYLPVHLGLLPCLKTARSTKGQALSDWLQEQAIDLDALDRAWLHFWPRLDDQREPDLLILLGTGEAPLVALLVEAKLRARQHDSEDRSQLGHYAQKLAAGGFADDEPRASLPRVRAVLYLTQDPLCPEAELERADRESPAEVAIFWSSWRNLSRCATEALERTPAPQPEHQSLLNDLIDDLAARGLAMRKPFVGFEFDRA